MGKTFLENIAIAARVDRDTEGLSPLAVKHSNILRGLGVLLASSLVTTGMIVTVRPALTTAQEAPQPAERPSYARQVAECTLSFIERTTWSTKEDLTARGTMITDMVTTCDVRNNKVNPGTPQLNREMHVLLSCVAANTAGLPMMPPGEIRSNCAGVPDIARI